MAKDIDWTQVEYKQITIKPDPAIGMAAAIVGATYKDAPFGFSREFMMEDGGRRVSAVAASIAIREAITAVHDAMANYEAALQTPDFYDFESIGLQASKGDPAAQLYLAALAKLTSGDDGNRLAMDMHADIVRMAREVYQNPPAAFRGSMIGACRACGVHVGSEDYCGPCASKQHDDTADAISYREIGDARLKHAGEVETILTLGGHGGGKTLLAEQLVEEARARGQRVTVIGAEGSKVFEPFSLGKEWRPC